MAELVEVGASAAVGGRAGIGRRLRDMLRDPSFSAGFTRAVLLPVSGVASLCTAHIELAALGASRFGVLMLVLTVSLLLPFADLGMGAGITNSVAGRSGAVNTERLVSAALRLLTVVAVLIGVAALLVALLGQWNGITGIDVAEAPHLDRDMVAVLALFGLGLPLSLGGRILLGLNRYSLFLLLQGSLPLITLALVFAYRDATTLTPFLLAPFVAQCAVSLIALALGMRLLNVRPLRVARSAFRNSVREHPSLTSAAVPMVIVTLGLPLALQTDRLVLSHVSTRTALAEYAVVAMLYAPAWAVISGAGISLWPRFAAMAEAERVVAYRRAFRFFVMAGIVGAVCLALLGPLVTRLWAGSTEASLAVWSAFALLLFVQAAHIPGGMFLTDPQGLRFQARAVVAMCAANVPLSIVLAKAIGASGPVLASAATICVLQLLTTRGRVLRSTEVPC